MGEALIARRGGGSVDGHLFPQSDYTMWNYGIIATQHMYTKEPTKTTYSSTSGAPSVYIGAGLKLYSSFSYSNGIITFSGEQTAWEGQYGPGLQYWYYFFGNYVYRLSNSASGNNGYVPTRVYAMEQYYFPDVKWAGNIAYYGHVYSEDSNAFPDGATHTDGLYYKKATNWNLG